MAVTLYAYGTTAIIADIKAALNAKGLITAVLYENTTNLIFSTPLLSKVVKITLNITADPAMACFYGDAWTSGTTITNPIQFSACYVANDYGMTGVDVLADTNFFMLIWKTGALNGYGIAYVGQLDSGDDLVFGMAPGSNSANNAAYDITTGEQLTPLSLKCALGIRDASGNVLAMPLMWANSIGTIKMNGAAVAVTTGVKVSSSLFGGVSTVFVGSGFYLTPTGLYMYTTLAMSTSLLIEFTP